jgi:predicted RNA-binding Zn ribbon-like protein
MTALVALVNDWGSRPRQVGHREPPAADEPGRNAMIAVADRLHAVFEESDPARRAAAVTAMLADSGVRPELIAAGDTVTAGWHVPRPGDALPAAAALALRDHLAAHPDRAGVCHDRQCADVYVDVSPAGHRRFCSLTCQNRSRAAAFRDRRRRAAD